MFNPAQAEKGEVAEYTEEFTLGVEYTEELPLGEVNERNSAGFANALSQFQNFAELASTRRETNRSINETAVDQHAFQRRSFLRNWFICYYDAARIRK